MALGLSPKQIIDSGRHPLLKIHESWHRVKLEKIALVQNGYAFKSKYFSRNEGTPLIRIRDINREQTENFYTGDYDPEYLVETNDILVGMDGDFNVARWPGKHGLLNQRVCRLIIQSEFFDERFFFYCLQPYLDAINTETSAVTVKHLSSKTIKNIPLPLPPLPEQRAIVAKLEALFSELDAGVASLQQAQAQLKVYRQAVLKKAFEGELTREWREQQTDLPTAEVLLAQIQAERERYYAEQVAQWEAAVAAWEQAGKVGKKPRRPGKLKEFDILQEDLKKLPKLSKGWLWSKLGNVCLKIMDGTHFSPKNGPEGDYMYITAKNIKEGRIKTSNITYVSKEDHREIFSRCDVSKDDVLYIKDGATTGIAAVNPFEEEFSLLSSVGVFRPPQKIILPKYLEHFLNSEVNRNRMLKKTAGVAITRLTLVKLNNSFVTICSPQEQHQIVQQIESRLSVCDQVEKDIVTNLQKAERLRQSLLQQAFAGALLTEDELAACRAEPDWEPAEVLLERIKKSRD